MSGARRPVLVVKLGTSSVTTEGGHVDTAAIGSICAQIAQIRAGSRRVVVVSSGAIAAGWSALGEGRTRSKDPAVLQAVSAVGQPLLVQAWIDELARHGLVAGQVLLAPLDFFHRQQYLHARQTLDHLLELGVVPIVNENDAVADDEIRFGDNDRLAALVSNLVGADRMALLTDTPGLFTADPRQVAEASLIEEVIEIDHQLEQRAGGPGSPLGSGGMASKLAAAKIATWSGVETGHRRGRPAGRAAERGGGRARGRHRVPGPQEPRFRRASSGSRSPAPAPARWWSTTGPARPSSRAAGRCSRPASPRSRAPSNATTPSRSSTPRGRWSPRAWCSTRRRGRANGWAAGPSSSPPTWLES